MKKFAYMAIGSICTLILSFSYLAFAHHPSSSQTEAVVGQLVSVDQDKQQITVSGDKGKQLFPLADSVWVLRDQKKATLGSLTAGDQVELILNAKSQVNYIKATTAPKPEAEQKQVEEESVNASPAAAPEVKESAASTPAVSPIPKQEDLKVNIASNSGEKAQAYTAVWEELEIEIEGEDVKVKIKQEEKKNKSEVEVERGKGNGKGKGKAKGHSKQKWKGKQAEKWIEQNISVIHPSSSTDLHELALQIANQLELNLQQVDMKIKIKIDGQEFELKHEYDED